jgi:hypothetical protein
MEERKRRFKKEGVRWKEEVRFINEIEDERVVRGRKKNKERVSRRIQV